VVDLDLEKFFDRVNHDKLMGQIAKRVKDKRLLKLIRAFLNAGVMENGLVSPSVQGTPQGGPLSPLLSNLVLDELEALWQELFARPAHPKLRRDLMIPVLAYRMQEKAYGGLKPSTLKRLQKLAEELKRDPKAQLPSHQFKSGTKLVRQWQGKIHEVLVVDEGFNYQNKRHESLSEIARRRSCGSHDNRRRRGVQRDTSQPKGRRKKRGNR
jgi:hypothetical protein